LAERLVGNLGNLIAMLQAARKLQLVAPMESLDILDEERSGPCVIIANHRAQEVKGRPAFDLAAFAVPLG
jgi:hypothetical protein